MRPLSAYCSAIRETGTATFDYCGTCVHVHSLTSLTSLTRSRLSLRFVHSPDPPPTPPTPPRSAFQHYKSGVFDNATGCGTKLDHGVLVVGYTPDYYIVKNSWGATWGLKGFIYLKRGLNICGISADASYPSVGKAAPVPVPPPTPGPKPGLPCNCTETCQHMCSSFGMTCCSGAGGNCDCMPLASCPQCNPHPPNGPYARCTTNE